MPNWCNNVLTIEGENHAAIAAIAAEFERVARREKAEECGQLLFDSGESFLFEITPDDLEFGAADKSLMVSYQTRWSPNFGDLQSLARDRRFDFWLQYEELGNLEFGEIQFAAESSLARRRFLTGADFDRVQETDDGTYSLDGEEYESDTEAYEKLLEEKPFEEISQSA